MIPTAIVVVVIVTVVIDVDVATLQGTPGTWVAAQNRIISRGNICLTTVAVLNNSLTFSTC